MSINSRVTQFISIVNSFFALKPEDFFNSCPNYNDYDGPDVAESSKTYQFIYTTIKPLIDAGQLNEIPWAAVQQLQQQAQNSYNTYTQLLNSRDQGSFQNFAVNLDSFANLIRMYGIPYLAAGGHTLDTTRTILSNELDTLIKNNKDVEELKLNVKTLITPAIAGSLSKSFTQRRNTIMINRYIWLVVSIVIGGFVFQGTSDFVNHISEVLIKSKQETQPIALWPTIAIRSIVLLPLFVAFGFSFSQYRKEREYEEEYAHKAAVAASLPNYGDLAREQTVKDQIVTGATAVIFNSPSQEARNTQSSEAVLSGVKEIIESFGKAFSKK